MGNKVFTAITVKQAIVTETRKILVKHCSRLILDAGIFVIDCLCMRGVNAE